MKAITYKVLLLVPLSCLVLLFVFIGDVWYEQKIFVIVGNFLQIIIPCMGYYISLVKKDKVGIKQFLCTASATVGITYAIKWMTYYMGIGIRPSGETKSFPSGHTSCSFQGAFFLLRRYGWKWGAPMLILAGSTAYSRIYGLYHHWRDVIAGFFIALLVSKLFVTPLRASRP
ncbi:MAG: phosphatase PAP2 family protein [Puniceicoccales bacterium]|jgi:membrane-associated phospholipid phosphatase|nr:phosphatase PAP2 family protein [Puniceicoccales bacterium]